jgi:hypothetical protein
MRPAAESSGPPHSWNPVQAPLGVGVSNHSVPHEGVPFPTPGHQLPHRPYFQDFTGTARGGRRFRGGSCSDSHGGPGGGNSGRRLLRHEQQDRPKKKRAIPGAEPWVLVITKLGRTFIHNLETKSSLWTAPQEIQEMIDVMLPVDKAQERREREERRRQRKVMRETELKSEGAEGNGKEGQKENPNPMSISGHELWGEGPATKKRRLKDDDVQLGAHAGGEEEEEGRGRGEEEEEEEEEEENHHQKIDSIQEFTEEDIAWQLEAMAEQYDLAEDLEGPSETLTAEESTDIFRSLLSDNSINPYSTWEDVIPIIIDDQRYTILPTTKARKAVFTDWCKATIACLRVEKESQKQLDPRISFWKFLMRSASTKLFWPEFKRKWRKESAMKESKLGDKEREKMYREYIARMLLSSHHCH